MRLRDIHVDVWLGSFFIALAAWSYKLSYNFYNPEAALWPRGVLIIIIILSTLLFINGLRLTKGSFSSNILNIKTFLPVLLTVLLIVAYAVTMEYFGFFMSTALFVPLGMSLQGQKNWKLLFSVTLGLELFVYVLFVICLQLRMP